MTRHGTGLESIRSTLGADRARTVGRDAAVLGQTAAMAPENPGRDRLRELLDAVLDEDDRTLTDMAGDAYASPYSAQHIHPWRD